MPKVFPFVAVSGMEQHPIRYRPTVGVGVQITLLFQREFEKGCEALSAPMLITAAWLPHYSALAFFPLRQSSKRTG